MLTAPLPKNASKLFLFQSKAIVIRIRALMEVHVVSWMSHSPVCARRATKERTVKVGERIFKGAVSPIFNVTMNSPQMYLFQWK